MTGKGPRKAVGGGHAPARLLQARELHESARSLVTLAQSKSYNAAVTLMVTAAIAYSDAITAKARGVVKRHKTSTPRKPSRPASSQARRRRASAPMQATPAIHSAQVPGSGTALTFSTPAV